MDTYKARRKFFHMGKLYVPGNEVELTPMEAARLQFVGYIGEKLNKPRRSKKHAKPSK